MTHMCSIRCKFGSPGSGFSSRTRVPHTAGAGVRDGHWTELHRARRRPRALAQDRPACTVRGGARRRRTRTRHREHLTPARLRAGSSRHRIRSPAPHKSPAEQKVAGTAEGRPHRTRSSRSPALHKSPAPHKEQHPGDGEQLLASMCEPQR